MRARLVTTQDATRSETTAFTCPCGATHPVTRVYVVDVVAARDRARRIRGSGPFEGTCPSCRRVARAWAPWVEFDGREPRATLLLSSERRGELREILVAHLQALARWPEIVDVCLLQPQLEWIDPELRREATDPNARAETTARRAAPIEVIEVGPPPVGRNGPSARGIDPPPPWAGAPELQPEPGTPQPISSGVPEAIGSDGAAPRLARAPQIGAWVGTLELVGGVPTVRASVGVDVFDRWKGAKLDLRPVHLRGRGYPLVGVRMIGAFMGQVGCIDGIVDVGAPQVVDLFRLLAQRFTVRVEISAGGEGFVRDLVAGGLESNAALCLESARGALAQGDHPPAQFEAALAALARETTEERLAQTKVTIAPGAYQHVVGAREATRALEHLDRVSRKETLARLLEVEGLPMGEYDAIRRRVLAGSLEHGIVAPRRFWRRVIASGLADDLSDYVDKLARARAEHEGEEGDLEPEQARAAWESILEVCTRKQLQIPGPLRRALDLPEGDLLPRATSPAAAAGVIDVSDDGSSAPSANVVVRLADPRTRLKAATELMHARASERELANLFDALEQFDGDELLAILPDLSDLGPRAVAGLVAKLRSDRRELRQAAVILLGMSLDPDALGPLSDLLVSEPTNVWLDVARALGGFGPLALRRLCQLIRRESGTPREALTIERVARGLAEIALSEGGLAAAGAGPGHDAVAALADAPDPRVSAAARRALATLRDVRESGAAIRGELPLTEVTEVRGFSRRAYEAIMVPELEVEAEG